MPRPRQPGQRLLQQGQLQGRPHLQPLPGITCNYQKCEMKHIILFQLVLAMKCKDTAAAAAALTSLG